MIYYVVDANGGLRRNKNEQLIHVRVTIRLSFEQFLTIDERSGMTLEATLIPEDSNRWHRSSFYIEPGCLVPVLMQEEI